jgi:hypothetical protein
MYGIHTYPQIPYFRSDSGVNLGYGVSLPPGGNVIYCRSTGVADFDPPELTGRIVPTLAAALSQCRSGKMDTVVLLPGHAETVSTATMLDNLVAGTRILGVGHGTNRPTFTFSATTSKWTVDNADVVISNCIIRNTAVVANTIDAQAANFAFIGNEFITSLGTGSVATLGVTVSSVGSTGCQIIGNKFYGTGPAAGLTCTPIKVTGATEDLVIANNRMICQTASNGCIGVTAAATNILIDNNILYSTQTASTSGITIADVASSGLVTRNLLGVFTDATAGTRGIVITGTTSTIFFAENYGTDESRKSGLLTPVACT